MKGIIFILLSGILFLTACGQGPSATQPLSIPVFEQVTSSPSPLSPPALTTSITPLSTIPTFTPTFDVSTIVTVTPAPKAECPTTSQTSSTLIQLASYPSGQKYIDSPEPMLEYLNKGGKLESLRSELSKASIPYFIEDITNDDIPDLTTVYGAEGIHQFVLLFWCERGKYNYFPKDLAEAETLISAAVEDFSINDLNKNGIPDILSIGDGRTQLIVNILEWNGEGFIDLTASETQYNAYASYAGRENFHLLNLNNDDIPEIIIEGHANYWYFPGEPFRSKTHIYRWNGKYYSESDRYSSPEYRFQAIQDGDSLIIQGEYSEAANLYNEAINSNALGWWSKERYEVQMDAAVNLVTPTAIEPDKTEYPRLAAYAYYRIMLIHFVQNQEDDVNTTYNTLQQKFGSDPYGHPYVEMASTFWEAYQSTHTMYDGCAAAIQYAVEHPDILTPLGSDYHGVQSHIYVPADVCPFR